MRISLTIIAVWFALAVGQAALAQTNSCTLVTAGTNQNITAFSVCKKVTNNAAATVCAVTGVDSTQWASFYDNPPSGVTIASCSSDCTAPWGTVYTDGSGTQQVSPYRYPSPTGCFAISGEPTCAQQRAAVSCSGGVLTCSDGYYGVLPCSAYNYTSCTNEDCGGGSPPCCFVGESVITMADGTQKPMSELQVGDQVRGATRINTVLQVSVKTQSVPLYSFNGGKAFVTGGHPFRTAEGWKAIEPSSTRREGHGVSTTQLRVGDWLMLDDGSEILIQAIDAVEQIETYETYSPIVDGDNTYFSNGYLVHNKQIC